MSENCPDCDGSGYTSDHRWLQSIVHLLMIAGAGALYGKELHPWLEKIPNVPSDERTEVVRRGVRMQLIIPPTRRLAQLTSGLAGRAPRETGHDGLDLHVAVEKIVKVAGLSRAWGICRTCEGRGYLGERRES